MQKKTGGVWCALRHLRPRRQGFRTRAGGRGGNADRGEVAGLLNFNGNPYATGGTFQHRHFSPDSWK